MPDVSRSDSQRSDTSARPRVSFNRDVHVKRIGSAGAPRVVGALAGDAAGRLLPLAVRRERPTRLSRRDLAKEAQRVLEQADKVTCTSESLGLPVDKYSTLPPARRKKHHRIVKGTHSLREKGPGEGNSSSSTERGTSVKRPRTSLARSASDVGNKHDNKPPIITTLDDSRTKFWSLDRLRSRKNKRTDDVDKNAQIASILSKKSHSDSEKTTRRVNSDSEAGSLTNGKKKQLSPIIEASPREDYFAKADEVEVEAPKRPTKEPKAPNRVRKSAKSDSETTKTTDSMETMVHSSQAVSKPVLTRGRTVDTMVRKLSQDRAGRGPPRVVSPLALVGSPGEDRQHNGNLPFSYTEPPLDSLLLVDDGYGKGATEKDKYLSPTPTGRPTESAQVIYAEVVCNGGGRPGKTTVHTSVPLGKVAAPMTGKYNAAHHVAQHVVQQHVVEGRGRADGMDSRRNMLEDESYRRVSPIRRNLMEDFINNESNRQNARRFGDERIEPVLQKPRLVGNLDLSSRRDRLESRIESQRKDRLLSSRSHQDINDSRIIDNHRKYPSNPRLDSSDYRKYPSNPRLDGEYNHQKYPSNPRLDSEYNRREFLNSQLNNNTNNSSLTTEDRYYGDTSPVDKKDQLTDSGIDINYHGVGHVVSELRTFHNTYETTTNTDVNVRVPKPKSARPTVTNVTKVDVNGHINSDDDEDDGPKYYYNQQENIDQIKKRSGLQSTKLVQESAVVPPSAVLIRHYAPDAPDEGYAREWAEERHALKRKCDLGDIEETRRFLAEERRRSVGDEGRRPPEKVQAVQKRAKKPGTMDKMRALFSRGDAKKKKKDGKEVTADPLTSRYVEYKGSNVELDRATTTARPASRGGAHKASSNHLHVEEVSRSRRERLPTPSPSPSRPATLNRVNNRHAVESDNSTGSWFKSLDRLRGKNKPKPKIEHQAVISENEDEHVTQTTLTKHNNNNNNVDKSNKNLRFFGDTDAESVRSHKVIKPMTSLPENPSATRYAEAGSQQSSTRYVPLRDASNNRRYKSGNNKLQVPRRRHHRSAGELATSSAESTTEGDSSQQSQRSVVYLHAATVGDIPGRANSRTSAARRARSREELSSNNGSTVQPQPQTRTVSRSISVLAPWKPRHYRREGMEVRYDNGGTGGKPPKVPSTLGRLKSKNNADSKSYGSLSRDKENVARKSLNSLGRDKYESTDSLGRDAVKGSRRALHSARSIESLGQSGGGSGGRGVETKRGATTLKKGKVEGGAAKKRAELSRSVSMPKDSKVKSGWFRRKTRS